MLGGLGRNNRDRPSEEYSMPPNMSYKNGKPHEPRVRGVVSLLIQNDHINKLCKVIPI